VSTFGGGSSPHNRASIQSAKLGLFPGLRHWRQAVCFLVRSPGYPCLFSPSSPQTGEHRVSPRPVDTRVTSPYWFRRRALTPRFLKGNLLVQSAPSPDAGQTSARTGFCFHFLVVLFSPIPQSKVPLPFLCRKEVPFPPSFVAEVVFKFSPGKF